MQNFDSIFLVTYFLRTKHKQIINPSLKAKANQSKQTNWLKKFETIFNNLIVGDIATVPLKVSYLGYTLKHVSNFANVIMKQGFQWKRERRCTCEIKSLQ